jgi:hypothetical protein
MTAPRAPRRSSALARYGPIIAIAVVIAVVAVVAIVARGGDDSNETASATSTVDVADLPPTYAEAQARGDNLDFGDRCDTATGTVKVPLSLAPPCVPIFDGDNGGATAKGVTADMIKVAYYVPQQNSDTQAALQGLVDSPETTAQTRADFVQIMNEVYELYGRKVELVPVDASGAADDPIAAKNDAVKIAEEVGAFAAVSGPGLTNVYADELASRGVICIQCGLVAPDAEYQKNAPYMWGTSATPEQFLVNVGDYVAGRLLGRNAEFAGDPALHDKPRVFGTVHLELDPPVFTDVENVVNEQGREEGYVPADEETYLLDVAKAPEVAPGIIARMKAAGVTTVVFLGDPIMPIYLTKAATQQDYFPEWVVTGTGFTDSTAVARLYDQRQWAHAFGLSSLPVRTPREIGDAWRLHEWWFGTPPPAQTVAPIVLANLSLLFSGLHMAGPDLRADTFQAGMFHLPEAGGGPTTPHVSFGDHGYFHNLDGSPRPDYLGIDDMTEIWWDADTVATDEGGRQGSGVWRYSDGGQRYLPGTMPKTAPHAFVDEGSVVEFDASTLPASERNKEYPPWPGSPAAGS